MGGAVVEFVISIVGSMGNVGMVATLFPPTMLKAGWPNFQEYSTASHSASTWVKIESTANEDPRKTAKLGA